MGISQLSNLGPYTKPGANLFSRQPLASVQDNKRAASGFMVQPEIDMASFGKGAGGIEDMVAMAHSYAQMEEQKNGAISHETERSLARLRAMNIQANMFNNLPNMAITDTSAPASDIVKNMNLESIASSANFGNLRSNDFPSLIKQTLSQGVQGNLSFLRSGRQNNGFMRMEEPHNDTPDQDDDIQNAYNNIRRSRSARGMSAFDAANAVKEARALVGEDSEASSKAVEASEYIVKEFQQANEGGSEKMQHIERIVTKVSQALNLDPNLVKAVIKTESNFNHKAVSKAGAQGLMQLMPRTAREMGVDDPFNPVENIWGGARYLKKMLERHGGNLDKALASYNWGPGNFDRHGSSKMPNETRRYIDIVNRHYASFKRQQGQKIAETDKLYNNEPLA